MKRINVASGSEFGQSIGFASAVRVNEYIHVSGTASIADDGQTAYQGDLYRQTLRCIEIMKSAIEEAGGDLEDVVRTRTS